MISKLYLSVNFSNSFLALHRLYIFYDSRTKTTQKDKTASPNPSKNSGGECSGSNLPEQTSRLGEKISSSIVTNALLRTLSDPLNPITHSDIYERTGTCTVRQLGSLTHASCH
ncbi:hypothetical protein HYPSUDRAFT_266189 [Hypholoma sublateritium FD-334 SS-4]|uniref:Uncharacterized protein n=1 Tax=Hypholoma sublateritium (strain FD-334 SS-4) TaxID=945553 RepID=A0A0D2LPX9_HYPSF|nr:hypothetical protein HYPSUDRAFT_266189 [Hypholoma sublateritium FD-334 SS-4]